MTPRFLPQLLLAMVVMIAIAACNKSSNEPTVTISQVAKANMPVNMNFQCSLSPDYGDSIVYLQPSKTDFIIFPRNQAASGAGTFLAWPAGLVIDSVSGAINLSQSETGMRYLIGFVKSGTTDTCLTKLILAGITYADSIYVLGNNETLAVPYYNANPIAAAVCNSSDDNDYPDNSGHGNGDARCVFDGKDKKGKKGQANQQNIKVRTISGVINLKATVAAGAFGTQPADGTSVMTTIAYSLDDKSKKAIQQINVELIYYTRRSAVPAALVSRVAENNAAFFQNIPLLHSPRPPTIIVTMFAQ